MDQPGGSGLEAAGIEVERCEVLFEVDVKPLAACRLGVPSCVADKGGGDALAVMLTGDLGIQEEGVIASVRGHVDNADKAAALQAGCHPAKAVAPDLVRHPAGA